MSYKMYCKNMPFAISESTETKIKGSSSFLAWTKPALQLYDLLLKCAWHNTKFQICCTEPCVWE